VHVIMTLRADDDGPLFLDLIGVFSTSKRAKEIIEKINKRETIPGLDYEELQPFDGAGVVGVSKLNEVISNEGKTNQQLGRED
jgi:hypothetical protein